MELSHTSIEDRLDSLRGMKDSLPDQMYSQHKKNLVASLKRLLPGSSPNIVAIRDPSSGGIKCDPIAIGRILSENWQTVFNAKTSKADLQTYCMVISYPSTLDLVS